MFFVNVEGALFRGNQWLIIERSKKEEHAGGQLSLVGGTVEQEGHSTHILERTVKREIFEEVGILVKDHIHYVRSTSFVTDKGIHVIDIVFLCEYESGEAFRKSPDEVDDLFWMSADEIISHENAPIWLKESIVEAEVLRRRKELREK
ncbi:NUDIX domain-containing protein [Bacillus sp. FJAT-49705]|uniref:NUDIX domain-containing protein n=1 Tax=Cytobacillus citreus TaxID=2833586 RepID=A0ABS5NWC1_9BACI|nr:NUDIX domain-containing protein [Cytobacillus citreus]MBS4192137.1 NUDIX domain-containing protein [Cytobacillus citreus]